MLPPRLTALALILATTVLLWCRQPVRSLNEFDQPFYLGIAHDLVHHHRFTDGFMFASPAPPDGLRPPGMRFAPLYPALLAAAASLDATTRAGMDCVVAGQDHDESCPRGAPLIRTIQFAELVAVFWLLWWMARRVAGPRAGWLALALAFGAAPLLLGSVNELMTEMTTLCLCTAATAAAMQAACARHRRLAWAAAAGALLALTALTRPAFLYLIPAAILATAAIGRGRALAPLAAFAAASAATLAPWIARNAAVLGRPALTYGYDSHTLVQRIAFDSMDWREYAQSYLCWLPDGTALGRRFLGPQGCDRFGWDEHPNAFYTIGLRHLLPETLAASGGYSHHLGYLITHYLLRMPVWHLLVSIPLALRGAYVAHWWGFVLLWPALWLTWLARPGRRPPPGKGAGPLGNGVADDAIWRPGLWLLAWPAWFMLAFDASVAVNQVRYNLLLIPLYAVAGAWMLQRGATRLGRRAVAP